MNTAQLECFLLVAETLSFVRTAERLNITQPAVTSQIKSLEEELKVRLFKRSTRTVELTEQGMIFLTDARSMVEISNRALRRFQSPDNDIRMELLIGTHKEHEVLLLTSALTKLRNDYPNLNPVMRTIPSPRMFIYQQLAEENIDMVISFKEDIGRRNLEYTELIAASMVAVMRKDHPLARRRSILAEDMEAYNLILANPMESPTCLDTIQHEIASGKPISQLYLYSSIEVATIMVKAGFGIAIVPNLKNRYEKSLSYVPIKNTEKLSYGIYTSCIPQKPAVLKLKKYLVEEYGTDGCLT